VNRLTRWAARRVAVRLLLKFVPAIKELKNLKATETQAVIAGILIKVACLFPAACSALHAATAFLDPVLRKVISVNDGLDLSQIPTLTPDMLVALLIAYAAVRFGTKTARAEAVPAAPPTVEERK